MKEIWVAASIPTISTQAMQKKVHKYHDICVSLKKSSARHNEPRFIDKFAQCKREGTELFDVRTCKCKITDIENGECICIASNKVPNQEITFLIDQQRDRKMVIGGLDVKTTSQNIRRMKRKVHESDLESSHCQPSTSNTVQLSLQNTDSPGSTDTDDKGSDYESVVNCHWVFLNNTSIFKHSCGNHSSASI